MQATSLTRAKAPNPMLLNPFGTPPQNRIQVILYIYNIVIWFVLRHVTVEPSGFTRTSTILEMERPATSPHHPDLGNGIDLLHFYSSLATASTCSDSLPWILRLPHKKREKHATPSDPPPKRSLLGGFGAMMNKMVGRSSKKVCRVKARGISF